MPSISGRGAGPARGGDTLLQVVSNFADGFVVADEHGVIRLWNPSMTGYTGINSDDAIGQDYKTTLGRFNYQTGTVGQPLVVTKDPEGRSYFLYISHYEATVNGHDLDLFNFHDVSRLVASAETKNQFFAYVAHELKSPLSTLYMEVEELEYRLGSDDNLVSGLRAAVEQLGNNISDLTTANELGVPRVTNKESARCLQVSELLDFPWMCSARKAYPNVEIHKLDDFQIWADLFRTRQIITNLLSNATKYSPPGSPIVIEYGLEDEANGYIRFVDQGIGIPEHQRDSLFEAYYRADNTRGRSGQGLGLSLSAHLADQMGASLAYEPNDPQGSIFTLHVPTWAASEAEEQRPRQTDLNP